MTPTLTAADLIARLRSGVHAEPAALEIDWRSSFGDGPVLEAGFDPETGLDSSSDDAALCGDDLTKYGHDAPGPWRGSYTIRPTSTPKENPHV